MVQYLPAYDHLIDRFNMRPADVAEVNLTCPGADPRQVARLSANGSEAAGAAVAADGEVLALFGLALDPVQPQLAYIWMLSSPGVTRHAKSALRHGRLVLEWCRRRAGSRLICNHIHRENVSARAYITRLGAVIVPNPVGTFDFFYFPSNV